MQKNGKEPQSIHSKLLFEMKEGVFKNDSRLPPEVALAEQLGVSRTLLRDCLASLEREGFISRRQGIGTIINRHVLNVVTRMDLELEFLDMVEQAGAKPNSNLISVETINADEILSTKLSVAINSPVLKVARIITADQKPIIYCVDYISFQIVKKYNYTEEDFKKPIFHFLASFCNTDVHMDLTVVKPLAADEHLSGIFKVEKGTPLLNMSEIGYNFEGNKVLWSDEYYTDSILQHTVMRKKI